jgi:hypothetical protein
MRKTVLFPALFGEENTNITTKTNSVSKNSSADTPVTKAGVANFNNDENNDEQNIMMQFFGGYC